MDVSQRTRTEIDTQTFFLKPKLHPQLPNKATSIED